MLAQTEQASAQRVGWRQWARRASITLVSAALAVTLAGGLLHTKAGRPWMARIFGGGCPLNSVTAEQLDAARHGAVASARGTERAPARPAFVFKLDESTVADVKAWALRAGVACAQDKAWLIKCSDVPASSLGRAPSEGAIEELAMGFAADGRLVNITTLRRHLSPGDGSRVMREIATAVVTELGRPHELPVEIATGSVSAEPLSSMKMSLTYSDYIAEITALNLPTSGVAVREHYLSARD